MIISNVKLIVAMRIIEVIDLKNDQKLCELGS